MRKFLVGFSFKNNFFGPIPLIMAGIVVVLGIYAIIHAPITTLEAQSPKRLQLKEVYTGGGGAIYVICDTVTGTLIYKTIGIGASMLQQQNGCEKTK